jgi:NAD(P)-dependent dehydrogenase (short-subunit alcohol dehydrogenase family)
MPVSDGDRHRRGRRAWPFDGREAAAAGFTVAGADRSEEGLKELPDGIRREVADSADPAAARSAVARIAAEVGPPGVLVNHSRLVA